MLFFPLVREKRIVPLAYAFILAYAVDVLLIVLSGAEADDPLLEVYLLFVPVPVVMGCAASWAVWARYAGKRGRQ